MIITGNSNVDCFNRQGFTASAENEPVHVHWVGALKIRHFYEARPTGEKVRRLLSSEEGWKFLSIGTHDIFQLFQAFSRNVFDQTLEMLLGSYREVFAEFNAMGKFGWLVFPQPFHQVSYNNVTKRDMLDIARRFNREVETLCAGLKVPMVNPLKKILGEDGNPLSRYMQDDNSHMNHEGAKIYLDEIRDLTKVTIAFAPRQSLFEPRSENESFCSLLLNNLNIPARRALSGDELESALAGFLERRLKEKGLEVKIDGHTDLIGPKLLNTLDMVDTFTFATSAMLLDIPFDADLWRLNTIEKMKEFLVSRKRGDGGNHGGSDPVQSDFLLSMRGDFNDPRERQAILDAEKRISLMNDELFERFKENVVVTSEGSICPYGIVLFWIALNQARRGDCKGALALLARAGDPRMLAPFSSPQSRFYLTEWTRNAVPRAWEEKVDESVLYTGANSPSNVNAAAMALYKDALSLAEGGDNTGTIERLTDLVNVHPDFAPAHNDLGVLYCRCGDNLKALHHYETAARIQPGSATYLKNLADFYYAVEKDTEKALGLYTKCISLDPNDIEPLSMLGRISIEHGQLESAQYFCSRILEIDPGNDDAAGTLRVLNNRVRRAASGENASDSDEATARSGGYLVSAIVSVYNAERFMRGCLEDLEAQTIADRLEIVIVDSCSPQNERAVIEEFQGKYSNITYIRTETRETVYAAWNRAIQASSGKYITNANADDRHRTDAFEHMTAILEKHPEIALVYADIIITQTENETFSKNTPTMVSTWHDWDRSKLFYKGCFMGPQPMWRRTVHDDYGYFDESMVTSGDYEFWLRISQTYDFYHFDKRLGLYLSSPESIEHRNEASKREENRKILSLYMNASKKARLVRYAPLDDLTRTLREQEIAGPLETFLSRIKHVTGIDPNVVHDSGTWTADDEKVLRESLREKDHERSFPLLVKALLSGLHKSFLKDFVDVSSYLILEATSWWPLAGKDAAATDPSPKPAEYRPGLTSIIIPASPFDDGTRDCVESIIEHVTEPYEIILPAAASSKPPAWLKKLTAGNARCRIVDAPKNAGYGASCNAAIRDASGQYILILDASAVMLKGSFSEMLEHMTRYPQQGIIIPMSNCALGPQQIPGTEELSFRDFEEYAKRFNERNRHRYVVTFEADSICLLTRRSLFDRIGPFNEEMRVPYFVVNDYRMSALAAGEQTAIAAASCVWLPRNGLRSKGFERLFHEKWSRFSPRSETGQKLSAFVATKNARDHYSRGSLKEAIQAIMDGITYTPEDEGLYYCLSEILFDNKQYEQSMEAIGSLPENQRDTAKALEMLGYCNYHLGHVQKAGEYADRALCLCADSARALNLKGLLALHRGERKEAEALFRQAAVIDPAYADPCMHLGVMKWQNSEGAEALDLIERGFILSPETEDFSTTYNSAVTALKEFPRAQIVFLEACRLFPMNKKLTFLYIGALLQQEKYTAAMEETQKAMAAFGVDDGFLEAAIQIRDRLGPLKVDPDRRRGSLSVCMIVKNEEQYLARCLMSLVPVASEIIVVDTGSTDRTRDIARAFGAQVSFFEWTGDFSEARNVSLEKAVGEWVLVHDADEVLSPLDHDKLKDIAGRTPPKPVAYDMTTRNYITEPNVDLWTGNIGEYAREEAGSGWFPSNKIRLFVNDKRIRFRNPVHELLEPSIVKAGFKVLKCDIPIHHYGKLPSENSAKKAKMYYELGKKKLTLLKNSPAAVRELAIQAAELQEYDESIQFWREYLSLTPDDSTAYFNIATLCIQTARFDDALTAARKAFELNPGSITTMQTFASALLFTGSPKEAITQLELLLQKRHNYPPAFVSLAIAHLTTGSREEGLSYLDKLTALGYNCGPALYSTLKNLVVSGRLDQAQSMFDCIRETGYSSSAMEELFRTA